MTKESCDTGPAGNEKALLTPGPGRFIPVVGFGALSAEPTQSPEITEPSGPPERKTTQKRKE